MSQEYYLVNKPASEAFSLLRQNLKTNQSFSISIKRFDEVDTNTYGRYVDNNTLIIFQYPHNSTGFQQKTIVKVTCETNETCKVTLQYKGPLFYCFFCIVFILFMFIATLIIINNNTTGYTLSVNNVTKHYDGKPFVFLIFPSVLAITTCIISYVLYRQIQKTRSYIDRYLSYYFIEQKE